jgi:hypothetical protein
MSSFINAATTISLDLWLSILGIVLAVWSFAYEFVPVRYGKANIALGVAAICSILLCALVISREIQHNQRIALLSDELLGRLMSKDKHKIVESEIQLKNDLRDFRPSEDEFNEVMLLAATKGKIASEQVPGHVLIYGEDYPFYVYHLP